MKPQAAGHTRARPPWAPGSGLRERWGRLATPTARIRGRGAAMRQIRSPQLQPGHAPTPCFWLLPSGTWQTQTRRTDTSGSERTGHAGGRNVGPWG